MRLRFPFERRGLNRRKDPICSTTGIAFVIIAAASFGNASAFAQENRGTAEQRAACAPDAFRLCLELHP